MQSPFGYFQVKILRYIGFFPNCNRCLDASVLLADHQCAQTLKVEAGSVDHGLHVLLCTDSGQFSGQLPADALRSDWEELFHRIAGCLVFLYRTE